MYRSFGKRILDLTIAVIGLTILSPLFLFLAILIAIVTRGNPFFKQPRPGRNESIFILIKFRTMSDQEDSYGNLLPDEQRISKLGNWLRRTSLDEIPQLWNVIKGEMSLVGPRPLLPEYLPLYNAVQKTRHHVKPGITGHAQVNGRNSISWENKFEHDIWYVQNLSFGLDLQILLLTIFKSPKAIPVSEKTFSEKFEGSVQNQD